MKLTFRTFEEHQAADDALVRVYDRLAQSGCPSFADGEARQIIILAFFYREHAKALEDRVRAAE
jgi:hypothetical protein